MGEYPSRMGTGNGCFEGMSPLPLLFRRDEQELADASLPKRQRRINSLSVSEHSYMAFTDRYCNIVRQEKSLLSIMSIDSSTM
jgi:hypothetical protein